MLSSPRRLQPVEGELQGEHDHEQVIELAEDRDDPGHEVDRRDEVRGAGEHGRPAGFGDRGVAAEGEGQPAVARDALEERAERVARERIVGHRRMLRAIQRCVRRPHSTGRARRRMMPDAMLPPPRAACLIIADISGYTSYLAAAELDHAQDILADLMDTVVGAFRPTFKLAKLEGDAAFVFAVTEGVDGSVLQDAVEGCYFAFQRRRRDIRQATTCPCQACVRIPTLDLKIIAHHGLIAEQRMAGRAELVGRDVIVVHRLLKNDIEADLGVAAYAAYTDACLAAMGIEDPAAIGLREHTETVRRASARSACGSATWPTPGAGTRSRPRWSSTRRTRAGRSSARSPGPPSPRVELPDRRPSTACRGRPASPGSTSARRRADAASARSAIASTARTRSSRRSSTGDRPTTRPSASSCPNRGCRR